MIIKEINAAVNLIALCIIIMGVILAFNQPDSSIANTLVSAGVGAITGAAAVSRRASDPPEVPKVQAQ
jgi:hypothetical protein